MDNNNPQQLPPLPPEHQNRSQSPLKIILLIVLLLIVIGSGLGFFYWQSSTSDDNNEEIDESTKIYQAALKNQHQKIQFPNIDDLDAGEYVFSIDVSPKNNKSELFRSADIQSLIRLCSHDPDNIDSFNSPFLNNADSELIDVEQIGYQMTVRLVNSDISADINVQATTADVTTDTQTPYSISEMQIIGIDVGQEPVGPTYFRLKADNCLVDWTTTLFEGLVLGFGDPDQSKKLLIESLKQGVARQSYLLVESIDDIGDFFTLWHLLPGETVIESEADDLTDSFSSNDKLFDLLAVLRENMFTDDKDLQIFELENLIEANLKLGDARVNKYKLSINKANIDKLLKSSDQSSSQPVIQDPLDFIQSGLETINLIDDLADDNFDKIFSSQDQAFVSILEYMKAQSEIEALIDVDTKQIVQLKFTQAIKDGEDQSTLWEFSQLDAGAQKIIITNQDSGTNKLEIDLLVTDATAKAEFVISSDSTTIRSKLQLKIQNNIVINPPKQYIEYPQQSPPLSDLENDIAYLRAQFATVVANNAGKIPSLASYKKSISGSKLQYFDDDMTKLSSATASLTQLTNQKIYYGSPETIDKNNGWSLSGAEKSVMIITGYACNGRFDFNGDSAIRLNELNSSNRQGAAFIYTADGITYCRVS